MGCNEIKNLIVNYNMYYLLQTIQHNEKPHLYLGVDMNGKKLPKGWTGWAVIKDENGKVFGVDLDETKCYKDAEGKILAGKHALYGAFFGVVDKKKIKKILPDIDVTKSKT
jgi:hypothetical protein